MSANLPVSSAAAITVPTLPRTMRSIRSARVSSVVDGISTAPSFMAASMISQSAGTFPSISSSRWPRPTPCARRKFATWSERRDSAAKESCVSRPSSPRICSAGRSFPAAMRSKWSSAQLKRPSRGQRKSRRAVAPSSRWRSRKSRADRNSSIAAMAAPSPCSRPMPEDCGPAGPARTMGGGTFLPSLPGSTGSRPGRCTMNARVKPGQAWAQGDSKDGGLVLN